VSREYGNPEIVRPNCASFYSQGVDGGMAYEAGNPFLWSPSQSGNANGTGVSPLTQTAPCDVIYSTLSCEAVRRTIEQHYDLGTPLECTLHCRGINDIYMLASPEQLFAVRISRATWRSVKAVTAELDAMEHLRRRGVSVAIPVARSDGSFVTVMEAPEGFRKSVVFRWAKGRSPKYGNPDHAVTYGRLLGRLHAETGDFPPSPDRPCMSVEYVLSLSMELIRPRVRRLPRVASALETFAARLGFELDHAVAQGLDWGFCHGDVYPDNANIDGNTMVLFDFDYCGSGWRLLDLACYRAEARRRGLDDVAAWNPFISGYLEIRPQMAESLKFLRYFVMLRHLWIAGQWCKFVAEGAVDYVPDEFFEDIVEFCEKAELEV